MVNTVCFYSENLRVQEASKAHTTKVSQTGHLILQNSGQRFRQSVAIWLSQRLYNRFAFLFSVFSEYHGVI